MKPQIQAKTQSKKKKWHTVLKKYLLQYFSISKIPQYPPRSSQYGIINAYFMSLCIAYIMSHDIRSFLEYENQWKRLPKRKVISVSTALHTIKRNVCSIKFRRHLTKRCFYVVLRSESVIFVVYMKNTYKSLAFLFRSVRV